MAKRQFDTLTEQEKVNSLLGYVFNALNEWSNPNHIPSWKNVWKIASRYGTRNKIKEADFNLIKNMTISEIADLLMNKNLKKNEK